jgi:hypothetical protein
MSYESSIAGGGGGERRRSAFHIGYAGVVGASRRRLAQPELLARDVITHVFVLPGGYVPDACNACAPRGHTMDARSLQMLWLQTRGPRHRIFSTVASPLVRRGYIYSIKSTRTPHHHHLLLN